ncbi:MAG: LysM peptidoglycan-binding domain-containing protein [Christensenellales bacterium]
MYKVNKGDTLSKIAKRNNTTVKALVEANGIKDANLIRAGQELNIPGREEEGMFKQLEKTTRGVEYDPAKTSGNAADLGAIEGTVPAYSKSQELIDAANKLAGYEQNKPGAYQSAYGDKIQSYLDNILNREAFNYNFNADPMYQQYKNQYVNMGKMAMQDTMGNAAALSGGYGNSYASTAGNQAYQGYLTQMNNVIPELYDAAYARYQNEGNELYNKANMLQSLDQTDYGKYQDTVSNYYNDLNYYSGKYGNMSDDEYAKYQTDLNKWMSDRDYYYGKTQADQQQKNWQAEYDLAKKKR